VAEPARNVELIVRGHHLEITPSLRTYVEEKIGSLSRLSRDITLIEVELTYDVSGREGNAFRADGLIHLTGPDIRAEERASEMHATIDLLQEKLAVQLRKHKERALKDRRRGLPS
jgi:putative sigma-54 modulation protein